MTTEEKFRAAVNVIRNLPKNGSYQPSHELMLRFYAYYKQATEGPNTAPRPGFWEVVKKMKWDAWSKLGNMSREEAMNNYVEELKKIVETMSYTDNVANFLGSLGSFYDSVPVEDLELLVGNVIERMRSQPGSPLSSSPFASREASPHRVPLNQNGGSNGGRIVSSLETSPASSYSASPLPPEPVDEEEDEEEFIDTVEVEPERIIKENSKNIPKKHAYTNGTAISPSEGNIPNGIVNGHHNIEDKMVNGSTDGGGTVHDRGRPRERASPKMPLKGIREESHTSHIDISEQIRDAVLHLQRDLDRVTARVRSLEVAALSGANWPQSTSQAERRKETGWWPFPELSPRTMALVLLWPFFVHAVMIWLQRRRQRRLL